MNSNSNPVNHRFAAAATADLDPQQPSPTATTTHPQAQRRPRGFAATFSNDSTTNNIQAKSRKEREKEKERTKLRERHRRAITSRMLAGLRQYGNFPLPARADMNDVIAALAREAGWAVEADGTTYKQSSPAPPPPTPHSFSHLDSVQQNDHNNAATLEAYPLRSVESPLSSSSFKNCSMISSVECQPSGLRIDESLSSASLDSAVAERDVNLGNCAFASAIPSSESLESRKLVQEIVYKEHGNGLSGNSFIPVYVKLSTGLINNYCQLMDPEGIKEEIHYLKSLCVDGVVVDCWWGIVEGWTPQKYEWAGYRELFNIIQEFGMKLQVVMAFHEHGGYGSGFISLPQWILEIGKINQDIFFTDREGRRNTECLSWGIDKKRVLRGRTGIEVYYDFMRSFRTEFDDLFIKGLISAVEIGLGPSGELKYPSFSERMGWRYPGIGEFQCYDKYSLQDLGKAAKLRGHAVWARGPEDAGYYNSKPQETGFFGENGDYDSYYGRFFLQWYSLVLLDHADNVLSLARLAFEEIQIVVKIPAVFWWYKTTSHAAELTAGYYNCANRDGYSRVFDMLKKHAVTMNFVVSGALASCNEIDEASSDHEGLSWQILNSAWDQGLSVAGQNAQPCYDKEGFTRLLETAKPRNHPDGRHFSFFAFQQHSPLFQRTTCFTQIESFIEGMHGELS
ncbi:beta-amylase 8 isoform X1 [Henckelia pumila]|uniref:beta-amylase 8 isoform X1 n=1 Tax=Henckelia pumila TaxID=405737 RepID=UPI003C6E40C0